MINEFRASFVDDLAKPSRFKVIFNPRDGKDGTVGTLTLAQRILDTKTLSLRCESASLPGRNLATADLRIYGPTEKFPYQSTYDDITLTFICTDSMKEKLFFNQWMEIINPENNWNFNYKSNYAMDITIQQFDNSNNVVHSIELIDAFPVSVNEMQLDWASVDTYHKLPVTFAYTYWKQKNNNYVSGIASTDEQITSDIPSLLSSPDSLAQRRGTFLNITNQSIGPFDTIKDQEASRVNKNKI